MKKIYSLFNQKLGITILLLALLTGFDARATIWPIPNGDADTLEHFIELQYGTLWQPGDTIMLIDKGPYVVNNVIDIHQTITLTGDPSLSERPVVQFFDNGFQVKDSMLSVTLKDIVFNGFNADSSHRAPFLLQYRKGVMFMTYYNTVFDNVEAYGFRGGLDLDNSKHCYHDTIIVNNCVWHNFLGDYAIDPNINHAKYISVTNSTFYNIQTGFLKNPDYYAADPAWDTVINKKFVIDHNTFYKVAGNNNSLIQINDPTDETVDLTFSNNIVSKLFHQNNARPFRLNTLAGDFTFTNCVFHRYDVTDLTKLLFNLDTIAKYPNVDTSIISRNDPLFADTTNYNFSLDYASLLLKMGTDGGPIGDPRWVPEEQPWTPGPFCHLIPNSAPDTLEHFIENYYDILWHDGDTIMLVSSGEYIATGTVDLFGAVTIMGDPRLSFKPTVRFYDNGFRPREDTASFTIKNLKLNGLKADNIGKANYFLRFDQSEANWNDIIIEDLEVFNFVGGVQFSKNIWCAYENVIINNCIFHDIGGSVSIYFIEPRRGALKNMAVTNSTFYNITTTFMRPTYFSDGTRDTIQQYITFNHNTIWKVVDGGQRFFQINDPKDGATHLVFENNIVSTLIDTATGRPFDINVLAGDFAFNNSTFHFFKSNRDGGIYNLDSVSYKQANVTASGILEYYPGFADTLGGSFMLPDTSSLLSAGTDGGAIGDPRWIPVAGVTIIPPDGAVVETYDALFTAEVNVSGEDKTVTWSVINGTGTATIDAASGLLSPLTAGTITVKAASNYNSSLYDQMVITIEPKIFVTDIAFEAANAQGTVTNQLVNYPAFLNIAATINPGNASDKTIIWSISPESDGKAVLEVLTATTAKLYAVQCGTVYVVASATDGSNVKDSIEIVLTKQTQVDSIDVFGTGDVSEITTDNGTLQMEYTIFPDTACVQEVTWSVDDEDVATISATGLLTAVDNGTVVVTARATDGSYKAGTATITISNQLISVRKTSVTDMNVLPNPAVDYIIIKSEASAQVIINNIVGTTVLSTQVEPDERIDISDLKAGIYIVNIKAGESYSTVRLIKK